MAASSRAPLGICLVWERTNSLLWLLEMDGWLVLEYDTPCSAKDVLPVLPSHGRDRQRGHKTLAVVVRKPLRSNLRAMLICKCVLSLDNLTHRSLHTGKTQGPCFSCFFSISSLFLWETDERTGKGKYHSPCLTCPFHPRIANNSPGRDLSTDPKDVNSYSDCTGLSTTVLCSVDKPKGYGFDARSSIAVKGKGFLLATSSISALGPTLFSGY
jgi:hypothetical protein